MGWDIVQFSFLLARQCKPGYLDANYSSLLNAVEQIELFISRRIKQSSIRHRNALGLVTIVT